MKLKYLKLKITSIIKEFTLILFLFKYRINYELYLQIILI